MLTANAANIPLPGLSEENKVQTPAFTDAVRLYRQAQGHYGTWEMMCGAPSQVSLAVITSITVLCLLGLLFNSTLIDVTQYITDKLYFRLVPV